MRKFLTYLGQTIIRFLMFPVRYWRERREKIHRNQLALRFIEARSMGGRAKE